MSQTKLDRAFLQRKPAELKATKQAPPRLVKKTSLPLVEPTEQENEMQSKLRAFDLDMTYGPCLGVTRLQRWERAQKNGLNPPMEIRELITDNATAPNITNNIWHEWVTL